MGFGAGLTSGLGEGEVPVSCVNVGAATKHKPAARLRPAPADILCDLGADSRPMGA
jgi:hypothetical protein